MNDTQIHEHIEGLVTEEHRLLEHGDASKLPKTTASASMRSPCGSTSTGIFCGSGAPVATLGKTPMSPKCAAKKSSSIISSNPLGWWWNRQTQQT